MKMRLDSADLLDPAPIPLAHWTHASPKRQCKERARPPPGNPRPVSAFSPFPVRNLLFLWTATCGFQPSKGNEKSHYILNIFPFLTKRKECKDDSSKESEGMHQSKQASEPRSSNPCLLDLSFAYTVKVTRQGRAVMHLSH